MVFFCNLLFSLAYTYWIGQRTKNTNISGKSYFLLLALLFFIWLLICGGQYNVGTDYYSYLAIFNNVDAFADYYCSKGEFGFIGIIRFCNFFGLKGQSLFYVCYGISFLFFYLILKRIKIRYAFIFILLYITVISLFNSQFNLLRQSVTIYIGTYASLLVFEHRNLKGLLFILFAMSIHISSAIFLLVYLHGFMIRIKPFWLFVAIGMCIIISNYVLTASTFEVFVPYLSPSYAEYIKGGNIQPRPLLLIMTKYIFIPIYLLALFSYSKYKLNTIGKTLFHIGILSFCFRLLFLNLSIVSRLSDLFLLLSIYPLYTYMGYLFAHKRHTFLFISILSALLLFYFLKTIVFPVSEYLYHSIYM